MNLLIYFQPGARGDFLASTLLDSFIKGENGQVQDPNYKKIHHISRRQNKDTWVDIINFTGIKIRIDPGLNAKNLLLIEFNHILKNNKTIIFDTNHYDQAYRAACYFILNEYASTVEHKNLFDHWVEFSDLYNLDYVENLYEAIHGKKLSTTLSNHIIKNLANQPKFDLLFEKLVLLLQFEIDNNLLEHTKYFNMFDELHQIEKFLSIENYSTSVNKITNT